MAYCQHGAFELKRRLDFCDVARLARVPFVAAVKIQAMRTDPDLIRRGDIEHPLKSPSGTRRRWFTQVTICQIKFDNLYVL